MIISCRENLSALNTFQLDLVGVNSQWRIEKVHTIYTPRTWLGKNDIK